MKSFELKNLGSKRGVFAQIIIWRGRRWNWGKSELVWSNQRFGRPSLVPICPVLQRVGLSMLCNIMGERSPVSLQLVIFRDPPHLFLYLSLFKTRKTKVETKRGSAGFEHRGVYTLLNQSMVLFGELIFIFLFILFYFYFNIFSLLLLFSSSRQAEYDGVT